MSVRIRKDMPGTIKATGADAALTIRDYAERAVRLARDLSPYATGTNRGSIKFEEVSELQVDVKTTSNYGAYLELGTRHMPARPYIAPAMQQALEEMK